jgi:nitrite reductase/ring-hydroxylating ferredoxin subunit
VPELAELAPGEVGGFAVAGTVVLACRVSADVGGDVYAYADRCPNCAGSLAGTHLDGAVLACPRCEARFDVVHAGADVEGGSDHLEPIPVLMRGGVLAMAVPEEVA